MTEEITNVNEAVEETEDTAKEEITEDIKEQRPVVFEEALEAILFAAGHPISYATLARVFEMTRNTICPNLPEELYFLHTPTPASSRQRNIISPRSVRLLASRKAVPFPHHLWKRLR